eukprot:5868535-Amphidinium_carterae.1
MLRMPALISSTHVANNVDSGTNFVERVMRVAPPSNLQCDHIEYSRGGKRAAGETLRQLS